MTLVILAGGKGTRFGKHTENCPKPLIAINDKPIIEHVINYYCYYGINDIVVCVGYLAHIIMNHFIAKGGIHEWLDDKTVRIKINNISITIVDTGEDTGTAKRLMKIKHLITTQYFFLTYADGLSNIDINKQIVFHKKNNSIVTLAAVHPKEKYGYIVFENSCKVKTFVEKGTNSKRWINGGYMIVEKKIFDQYLVSDSSLEMDIFPRLVQKKLLSAYKHAGFWFCMDSNEEKEELIRMTKSGKTPWKLDENEFI